MSHKEKEQKKETLTGKDDVQQKPKIGKNKQEISESAEKKEMKALGQLREQKSRPKKFKRFRRKQVRKRNKKSFLLGKGAFLVKKKKPQRKRPAKDVRTADKKETAAVLGVSAGKSVKSPEKQGKGTVRRLAGEGVGLVRGSKGQSDGERGESPEQQASDAVLEKAGQAGETILKEAGEAIKKASKEKEPVRSVQEVDQPQTHKQEIKRATGQDVKSMQEPSVQPVPVFQVPHSPGSGKLKTLEDTLGDGPPQGVAFAQNAVKTAKPTEGDSGEDGYQGSSYIVRKPELRTSESEPVDLEVPPSSELYPEPAQTAYDFHPEQNTSLESHKSGDTGEGQVHTEEQGAVFHTESREPESVPSKSAKNTTQDKRGQNGHPEKKKADYEKKKSGNSQLKVKETDSSVKISGKVELNTWQRDATVNQISNQTPALASGAAQVRSFANYGQAVMAQAGGGAAVGVAGSAATGGVGFAIQAGEKLAQKLTEQIKEAVQNAVSSFQSSQKSWGAITAIFFIPLLLMLAVVGVFRMGGSATNVGLSEQVLELMPQIREACQNNGIPEYVPLVAAVVMQESGGNVELVHGDVMQCAEGMGYPVGTPVPVEESLDFGTELLADYLSQAGSFGPSDIASISLALQSYNFGGGYLTWALEHYGGYSKENAQEFSDMQAAAMGWSGYGDPEYVDHVLRYYQVTQGGMGDRSAIANGFFAYPFPGHTWTTYDGHEGIDISFSGIEGQPVYAAAAGTVSYVQNGYGNLQGSDGLASYGNCVFIDHENGWESRYAHMTVAVAQQGQYVQEGQLLGYVGNTGNSYGAHLHLALYYYGSPSSGGVIYAEQAWPQLKE